MRQDTEWVHEHLLLAVLNGRAGDLSVRKLKPQYAKSENSLKNSNHDIELFSNQSWA